MLTEEKLPLMLESIDCESGCAKAVYRTVIKRDGQVIHTIYDHQSIKIDDMQEVLWQVETATDTAIAKKIADDKAAAEAVAAAEVVS